ncbi:uncharacterized protein LOC142821449 [Pelodiscus sinensis]|uniref:uncharacterized protein LOC142821449 n=1 Tax=Pelodiscus sinensis TaxID=13735 RepID=UPI003F6C13C8
MARPAPSGARSGLAAASLPAMARGCLAPPGERQPPASPPGCPGGRGGAAAAPRHRRAPPRLASGHQHRLVGLHRPGALGGPTVDPELQDEEGHLPGALRVARTCPAQKGHSHEARHPPPEAGGRRPLEALHAGQLPIRREPVRHGEIHRQSGAHAGGQGHQPGVLCRVVRLADPDAVIRGFGALGFPNCGGAIDGTHIPIRAPEHQASWYVNRKGYFSVILQAVCDHRGQFTDINVGWSGKAHNARVYRNSSVCQRLQAGTFFPDRHIRVGDVDMPMCLVGDAAYPLQPWLMKPYMGHLNPSRQAFNARLTKARIVVEWAFG